jgi:hypothetical protein
MNLEVRSMQSGSDERVHAVRTPRLEYEVLEEMG